MAENGIENLHLLEIMRSAQHSYAEDIINLYHYPQSIDGNQNQPVIQQQRLGAYRVIGRAITNFWHRRAPRWLQNVVPLILRYRDDLIVTMYFASVVVTFTATLVGVRKKVPITLEMMTIMELMKTIKWSKQDDFCCKCSKLFTLKIMILVTKILGILVSQNYTFSIDDLITFSSVSLFLVCICNQLAASLYERFWKN